MISPRHIAVIPDGNRTRARNQGRPQIEGHFAGFDNAVTLIKYVFSSTDIEVFTLWGLSTENLKKRSQAELEYLFALYKKVGSDLKTFLQKYRINIKYVGSRIGLPDDLINFFDEQEKDLNFCDSNKFVILAINYGGRDEILRGLKKYCMQYKEMKNDFLDHLTEQDFGKYLDFGGFPPVDLVIRTKANEARRLSGFMLWRIGYAELYFSDLMFPDFNIGEFQKALDRFESVVHKRNFGR